MKKSNQRRNVQDLCRPPCSRQSVQEKVTSFSYDPGDVSNQNSFPMEETRS